MKALHPRSVHAPESCPALAFHHQHRKSAHIFLELSSGNRRSTSNPLGFIKNAAKLIKADSSRSSNNRGGTSSSGTGNEFPSSSNGGGGFMGGSNGFPQDDGDSSSFSSSAAALVGENHEEEQVLQVRSFCCLNVGPVLDGSEWRAFDEEDSWRPCLLPCHLQAEIIWQLVSQVGLKETTIRWVKEQVEDWYHSQGYSMATVTGFSGLDNGLLCCRISEGAITDVKVSFKNANGVDAGGRTSIDVISRELPVAMMEGMPYNTNAVKEALRRMVQLHLFEKVNLELKKNEIGGVTVNFILQEKSQDGCNFQSGLSFVSSDTGSPVLTSLRPAATFSAEHCNIAGMNRTLHGYIHTNDLLSPQDDSRFKLEYVHPYVDGVLDPRDRIFRLSCYNSRKLTAVFSHPRNRRQVPAVWLDRAGLKTNITERFSKESKLTYGFVMEEVAMRDAFGSIQNVGGELGSKSCGIDHVPFLHLKITRDNTRLINGLRVGAVDTFQVDQGVGIGNTSFFNKHQLSTTRFISLQPGNAQSFPLGIVRARYGGIVGDIPSYRAFTNGGPCSLRGSDAGELGGGCMSFLELMSEVRVPVWKDYAYAFIESFTELQSLQNLMRNAGKGVVLGLGVKAGDIRTEFVFDCGTRTGSLNMQMGERV